MRFPAAVAVLIGFSAAAHAQATDCPSFSAVATASSFINLLALMSATCKTLKIVGREFGCKTVACRLASSVTDNSGISGRARRAARKLTWAAAEPCWRWRAMARWI